MLLKEFLERVLPAEGYKCWTSITKDKKAANHFCTSFEELAAQIEACDARGIDAYHACAAFKTDQNRRAANALCAKAFWLDIDAGEGKPYATANNAISACDNFCNRTNLPLPGLVRSGGGIHAYWVLAQPLDVGTWVSIAGHLKLLVQAHGFHADPSRTADIASILRPPGTKNYKLPDTPRSVEVDSDDGWEPVDTVEFIECVLQAAAAGSAVASGPAVTGEPAPPSNAVLLAGMPSSKAFDFTRGVKEGEGRNNALAKAFGELLARDVDPQEAAQRCWQWNLLNAPPLDDKEFKVTIKSILYRHRTNHPPLIPTQEVINLPHLPPGYQWGPQQQLLVKIKVMQDDGSEKEETRVVSTYPVYLAAILNHEHTGRENSYLFRQYSVLDGWNEFCIDSEGINSTNWYAAWYKKGGSIHAGMDKYFKTYIREAENMLRAAGEITRYSQFGWKSDNSFLVGDVLLKDGTPHRAHGTDKLTPLMRTMAVPKEGSLEEWTTAADKFFAPGMEAHGFALLTSFAAPLMKFVAGLGDGGSILSLISEDSGRGKTPISEAIASVWGDLDSTVVTGNFTENRRIESIVRHCNLPQVQEEMTLSDPAIAAESVKKFTTGCDRGRLDRSGAGSAVPERYQTILVSIANNSLYEMVAQVDKAASRRVFELEIKRPDNEAFSNLGGITREMMRCRAYAGRRYAQILTTPGIPQYLKEHLTGLTTDTPGSVIMRYRNTLETQAEHRFIVWLLATIDVAARLTTHYGLLHFDVERIMGWAVDQVWDNVEMDDIDDVAVKLQRFLGEYTSCCIVVSGAHNPDKGPVIVHTEPKGHLHMRMEIKTQRLYVSNDVMRRWCVRNRMSFIKFGKSLVEAGVLLERSRPITLGAGTMTVSARCYCWEFDLSHPAMGGALKEIHPDAQIKTA